MGHIYICIGEGTFVFPSFPLKETEGQGLNPGVFTEGKCAGNDVRPLQQGEKIRGKYPRSFPLPPHQDCTNLGSTKPNAVKYQMQHLISACQASVTSLI